MPILNQNFFCTVKQDHVQWLIQNTLQSVWNTNHSGGSPTIGRIETSSNFMLSNVHTRSFFQQLQTQHHRHTTKLYIVAAAWCVLENEKPTNKMTSKKDNIYFPLYISVTIHLGPLHFFLLPFLEYSFVSLTLCHIPISYSVSCFHHNLYSSTTFHNLPSTSLLSWLILLQHSISFFMISHLPCPLLSSHYLSWSWSMRSSYIPLNPSSLYPVL